MKSIKYWMFEAKLMQDKSTYGAKTAPIPTAEDLKGFNSDEEIEYALMLYFHLCPYCGKALGHESTSAVCKKCRDKMETKYSSQRSKEEKLHRRELYYQRKLNKKREAS